MKKYDVRFCDCGRVHFIDEDKLNEAYDSEKSVIHICNNCGRTYMTWLEDYLDGKARCGRFVEDEEFDNNSLNQIGWVVSSSGERIIMRTGGEATYHGGIFVDYESKNDDNLKNFERLRREVDIRSTINEINDDDKLEALSHYGTNIHWAGTKFEKSYNR